MSEKLVSEFDAILDRFLKLPRKQKRQMLILMLNDMARLENEVEDLRSKLLRIYNVLDDE